MMKLQGAILFEYLCFNTSMIKYFAAVFFCPDIISLQFCEINAYSLNCLHYFIIIIGNFHKKVNATFLYFNGLFWPFYADPFNAGPNYAKCK